MRGVAALSFIPDIECNSPVAATALLSPHCWETLASRIFLEPFNGSPPQLFNEIAGLDFSSRPYLLS